MSSVCSEQPLAPLACSWVAVSKTFFFFKIKREKKKKKERIKAHCLFSWQGVAFCCSAPACPSPRSVSDSWPLLVFFQGPFCGKGWETRVPVFTQSHKFILNLACDCMSNNNGNNNNNIYFYLRSTLPTNCNTLLFLH